MTQVVPGLIAIIPARGGSRGIPRKNLLPIAGKPLIIHTILCAQAVPEIERIIVSTEDEEIATVARRAEAEVIMRPADLARDDSPTEDALLHVLDTLSLKGYQVRLLIVLQPTSPLRRPDTVSRAIQQFFANLGDSLASVTQTDRYLGRLQNGYFVPLPDQGRRRQERAGRMLYENGAIYITTPEVLRLRRNVRGERLIAFRMDEAESFDIETPLDAYLVECIMKQMEGNNNV